MGQYAPEDIRNVAIMGHGTCGKTTLVETMLHKAGAVPRLGSVDDETSVCDSDPEERERKVSVDAAVVHLEWGERFFQILDTPGYRDFIGSTIPALSVVESAVVVVDAEEGVRVNTRKLWQHASDLGIPRFVLLSRLDREHARYWDTLAQVESQLGPRCLPLLVPDGDGPAFSRVENLLDAGEGAGGGRRSYREKLVEAIIESSEALTERYLEGEEIPIEELSSALGQAVLSGTVQPVLCASATKGIGVAELLDVLAACAPPATAGLGRSFSVAAGEPVPVTTSAGDPLLGYVFRVVSDPYVGKLSFVRIFSGSIAQNAPFVDPRTGKMDRVGKLVRTQGKEQIPVESLGAGEIGAIIKAESLCAFDAISSDRKVTIPAPSLPTPMVSLAVEPKSKSDEKKIGQALGKLADECPTFRLRRDAQTNEMVVSGMSQLHLQVMLSRLKARFDVEVLTKPPKTPYLETVTGHGDTMYRHKKQTGGAGQFAEVWMKVDPLDRGQGFEYVSEIVGGAISGPFVVSVEKGVRAVLEKGVIAGHPVTDVKVTVYDGKEHPVDSKDIAFQIAGREAFKRAFEKAKPVILEPIVNLEVTFPAAVMGDITGDLNSRRGRVVGMDSDANYQIIRAQVPLAEIADYAARLGSITGGEGAYSVEMSHYDVVPPHIQKEIVERAKGDRKKEE